jgi:hypothetical protein
MGKDSSSNADLESSAFDLTSLPPPLLFKETGNN